MKLYLAPIKDITTAYYRQLFIHIFSGIDGCYAPFISTTHMRKVDSPLFRDVLPENNPMDLPLIPQILGNDPSDFTFFANRIAALGYDEINWNIGCPSPKIIRKRRGSGILPYPDDVKAFLEAIYQDMHYNLSIKMRLGMYHEDEGLEIIELLNDYPLKNITIHGRTGKMIYSGQSDLDAFDRLQQASQHKIVYNGDIKTVEDYQKIEARFPNLEGCMIGRGLLSDPFLPSAIKGITYTSKERQDKIKAYHDGYMAQHLASDGDEQYICNKMKEFWFYCHGLVDDSGQLIKDVRRCNQLDVYYELIKDVL